MEISVIMPVYKVEKYLRQAIDSVLEQTFKDFELIIVDDGSPDNCPKICDEYAVKDSRIKVIHKENGGQSSARNAGLDIAKGKWIAFIDSDDLYKPDMLMKMWTLGEQDKDIDYVHCGVEVVPDGYPVSKDESNSCDPPYSGICILDDEITAKTNNAVWNKLFRADKINSIKLRFPEGLYFEDIYFHNLFAIFTHKVGMIPDKLYVYIRHSDSIMSRVASGDVSHAYDYIIIWRKVVDFLRQTGKLHEQRNVVFRLLMMCIGSLNYCVPNAIGSSEANDFLSYAGIDLHDLSFRERVNLFWWRHGKPNGGSVKYLGGLIKLQLKENKINVRVFGTKFFAISL